MTNEDIQATLYAVFALSRANLPVDAGSIGRAVGLCASQAAEALLELESRGLVDASRARLTMKGLVVAVSGGAGLAGARLDLSAACTPGRHRATTTLDEQGERNPDGSDAEEPAASTGTYATCKILNR